MTELWYLVYKDEMGVLHTVKGSTVAIRRSLREGLLGDATNIRASRSKNGPFESLRGYPEFRDMVVTAAPLSLPTPPAPRSSLAATVPVRPKLPDPSSAEHAPF